VRGICRLMGISKPTLYSYVAEAEAEAQRAQGGSQAARRPDLTPPALSGCASRSGTSSHSLVSISVED
jgi:hypothetical protein